MFKSLFNEKKKKKIKTLAVKYKVLLHEVNIGVTIKKR